MGGESCLVGSNPTLSASAAALRPFWVYARFMRKLVFCLTTLIAFGALAPAQAQTNKPEIVYVRATDDDEGIRFSAKVSMDKQSPRQRKVRVTYQGDTKQASNLEQPPLGFYETGPYGAPRRDCYRDVTVRATNRFGTTTRTVDAGRIGSDGCD